MAKRTMSRSVQSLGGKALAKKWAPSRCPKCGKELDLTITWYGYLGHLSFHKLADKYFGGDVAKLQKRLRENGQARQDPFPANRAFKPYRKIGE